MWMAGPNKLLIQQCCVILSFLITEELMANSTDFQFNSTNPEPIQNYLEEVIDDEKWNPMLPEYYPGPINYEGSSKHPSPIVIILIVIAFLSVVASCFAFCKNSIRFCR